jgi:hypothetical protein
VPVRVDVGDGARVAECGTGVGVCESVTDADSDTLAVELELAEDDGLVVGDAVPEAVCVAERVSDRDDECVCVALRVRVRLTVAPTVPVSVADGDDDVELLAELLLDADADAEAEAEPVDDDVCVCDRERESDGECGDAVPVTAVALGDAPKLRLLVALVVAVTLSDAP